MSWSWGAVQVQSAVCPGFSMKAAMTTARAGPGVERSSTLKTGKLSPAATPTNPFVVLTPTADNDVEECRPCAVPQPKMDFATDCLDPGACHDKQKCAKRFGLRPRSCRFAPCPWPYESTAESGGCCYCTPRAPSAQPFSSQGHGGPREKHFCSRLRQAVPPLPGRQSRCAEWMVKI